MLRHYDYCHSCLLFHLSWFNFQYVIFLFISPTHSLSLPFSLSLSPFLSFSLLLFLTFLSLLILSLSNLFDYFLQIVLLSSHVNYFFTPLKITKSFSLKYIHITPYLNENLRVLCLKCNYSIEFLNIDFSMKKKRFYMLTNRHRKYKNIEYMKS